MNDIIMKDIWEDDKLGRREDAELIRRFILGQLDLRQGMGKPRTFVLNLDSKWGGGKTFFLERFKLHLEKNDHICVNVNAWEDDHSDDPLIAVVSAINEVLREVLPKKGRAEKLKPLTQNTGKIVTSTIGMALKQLLKKGLGDEGPEALLAIIAEGAIDAVSADVLATFEDQKATIASFRDSLEKLVKSALNVKGFEEPIFVLIDELDRCRPDYAIKLLERVKHLFCVENIVFIVATDTGQLGKAIVGAYGPEFDGTKYLKRFFDRTYYFPEATKEEFISATFVKLGLSNEQFEVPPNHDSISFINLLCAIEKVELRDIEQMLSILQTFVSLWEHSQLKINLTYLIPIIYQLHEYGECALSDQNEMLQVIFEYPYYDTSTGRTATSKHSANKIINILTTQAKNIFSESGPKQGAVDEWVYRIFNHEQSILHNNRYKRGVATPSVTLQYPLLVARLSRLRDGDVNIFPQLKQGDFSGK